LAACFNRDDRRLEPTRSSSAIAGTFSDSCSALRTAPFPEVMSKFSGARTEADRPIVDQASGVNKTIFEPRP